MSFRFEKLNIWQDAIIFVNCIYSITKNFPKEERFGLIDQLRRAAVSIALNIAEGSDKKSDVEFRRFLRMSLGSLNETVTGLFIALNQEYLGKKEFDEVYDRANKLAARINATVNVISSR